LERTERTACLCRLWTLFVEAQRAATSYTTGGIYIKQISRLADLKNKTTFYDLLDAQDGNHPVARIPAAIPSSIVLLFQNY
jgi:hypothetical protein